MNLFSPEFRIYTGLFAGLCCIFLAILALFRSRYNKSIRLFVFSNLTLAGWNLNDFFLTLLPEHWALFSFRLSYIFGFLIVPSFLLLAIDASQDGLKPIKIPSVLLIAIFVLLPFTITPLIVKDVITKPTFKEVPGPLYPLFIIYFLSWLWYGLSRLYKAYKSSEGFKRNQLKYFFLALVIAFAASVNFFICMFLPNFPPLYYVIETCYTLVVAYAVIRYRLMDFDLLVRWGLAFGALIFISVIVFTFTMFASEKLIKPFHTIPGIPFLIGISVLVFLYEPLRKKTVSFIDHFIFQSPDLKEILRGISEEINSVDNLDSFSLNLSKKLKSIWKVNHAGVVTWDPQSCKFVPHPTSDFSGLAINSKDFSITISDFLIKTLEQERRLFEYGIVVDDEVDILSKRSSPGERATFWKIKRSMRWLGAKVCVPVMSGSQIIGFFVLGNKQSGAIYNREDKKFLSHLSGLTSDLMKNFVFGFQTDNLEFRRA